MLDSSSSDSSSSSSFLDPPPPASSSMYGFLRRLLIAANFILRFAALMEDRTFEFIDVPLEGGDDGQLPNLDRGSPGMELFFGKISTVNERVARFRKQIETLERMDAKVELIVDSQRKETFEREREEHLVKVNALSKEIKGLVNVLEVENNTLKDAESSKLTRICTLRLVSERFRTCFQLLQHCQLRYDAQAKRRMESEAKIVNPSISPEELDRLLFSENHESLFLSHFLGEDKALARQRLIFITERRAEIRKMERSIRELNQMFQDLAALVAQQDHSIAQIVESVVKTAENTSQSNQELREVVKFHRTGRCKCIIMILVLCAVVVAVVVPIIVTKMRQ